MRLSHLLYVSVATEPMDRIGLDKMLETCQKNNTAANITGLMLFSRGRFIQLLEGNGPALEALFAKISKDPRHQNVEQLLLDPAAQRMFPNWNMGLLNIDQASPLDRTRFQRLIDQALKSRTAGPQLLNVLRDLRYQLPALSDQRAA